MTDPGTTPPAPAHRHLSGSILSVALSRGVALVAVALTSIAIARILGPSGTGTYALSVTVLFMGTVVFELGLSQGTSYFVGRSEWSGRPLAVGLIASAAALGTIGAAVMLVAYALLGDHLPGVTWPMAIALAAALPWALAWRFGTAAALAQERFELYALLEAAWVVLALPLSIILAAVSGVAAAVLGLAAAAVIAGVLAIYWLLSSASESLGTAVSPPGGARSVVRFGVRAWFPELLQQVNYRADLLLLGALTTAGDTGVYSVAVSVTSIAWVLSGSFATSVLPRSASLSAESERRETTPDDRDLSDARAVRHTVLLIPALIVFEAVLLLVAVPLLYGSEFHRSIGLGFVLLPGSVCLGVGMVAIAILLGRGRTERVIAVGLAIVPATIAGYVLLIDALGATGAALVSTASYLSLTALALVLLRGATGLGARRLLIPNAEDFDDYRVAATKVRTGLKGLVSGS